MICTRHCYSFRESNDETQVVFNRKTVVCTVRSHWLLTNSNVSFQVQAIQLDGTFCFISFQYLEVNISFPLMVLVKKLPATIPFGNCDAPPFLPRGITMAILPGLYSLRLLFSFSLLIFSATTSVEKSTKVMLIRICLFIYTYIIVSPKGTSSGLSRGITHVQYNNIIFPLFIKGDYTCTT